MARYDKEHKLATRQRIVETSGRRLKQDGIDGSGIATLMADAKLTNGAFYAHFDSKTDLVATVIAHQLSAQSAHIAELAPGLAGVEQIVREYLSPEHRDQPSEGCPSAALLDEISRSDKHVRKAYTDGLLRVIDLIAARVDPNDPLAARLTTLSAFSLMIGTLQLTRAVTDRKLSDQLLAEGIANTLTLLTGQRGG
ncbi:MAG: putative TetR family transcriptional regulator [Aeromicrobium sp.]|nr:putative TetR family transcriptional regulator [Aeromicrobium sp.]